MPPRMYSAGFKLLVAAKKVPKGVKDRHCGCMGWNLMNPNGWALVVMAAIQVKPEQPAVLLQYLASSCTRSVPPDQALDTDAGEQQGKAYGSGCHDPGKRCDALAAECSHGWMSETKAKAERHASKHASTVPVLVQKLVEGT